MSRRVDAATLYGGGYVVIERFDKNEEIEIEKEGQCSVAKQLWTKITQRFEVVTEVIFICR